MDHESDSTPIADTPPVEPNRPSWLEQCPQCDRSLGAPLKATGRQVCAKCGWTDKPRLVERALPIAPTSEPPPDELKRLLDQAAAAALTNMKPKGKQDPNAGSGKRFPFLGK